MCLYIFQKKLYPHSQRGGYIAITLSICPLVRPLVHSHFPGLRTSTSCLPRDLELIMFAVMKTFVTDISASTRRNYFIFDMWLWHGDLYRVSPFQVYCTSTSCLLCDFEFFMFLQHFLVMSVEIYTNLAQMNEWGYSQHDVWCNILFLFILERRLLTTSVVS